MREIKFRAWDKERGQMQWGNSNLMMNMGGMLFWNLAYDLDIIGKQEQTEFILMQYTGLKDKNGKEIYEGDIVCKQRDFPKYIVKWDHAGFEPFSLPGLGGCEWECLDDRETEVIGNIYENPELVSNNNKEVL